jgi:hypothetical protein
MHAKIGRSVGRVCGGAGERVESGMKWDSGGWRVTMPFRAAGQRDWARAPAASQVLADLVAVHAGQVPVQDDHVVAGQGHVVERVLPVVGHVDGHAFIAQPARHRLREPPVIFHHQHSHTLSQLRPVCPASSGGSLRPGCQALGDSQVTASVTVLSPVAQ